jgi:hypothetical protein
LLEFGPVGGIFFELIPVPFVEDVDADPDDAAEKIFGDLDLFEAF